MYSSSSSSSSPQAPSTPESSLLPWPEHEESTSPVLPNDWECFPHPKELEYFPDGEQTPYDLRQIVKRSLYERKSESSDSQEITAEAHDPEVQSTPAQQRLPGVPENQDQESLADANSFKTCSGGSETASVAPEDAASPAPSPLGVSAHKERDLKPKSSFLFFKIERLGARIEKLEIGSSRRSSRSIEQQKHVEAA
jgi:hypothetical protein